MIAGAEDVGFMFLGKIRSNGKIKFMGFSANRTGTIRAKVV